MAAKGDLSEQTCSLKNTSLQVKNTKSYGPYYLQILFSTTRVVSNNLALHWVHVGEMYHMCHEKIDHNKFNNVALQRI